MHDRYNGLGGGPGSEALAPRGDSDPRDAGGDGGGPAGASDEDPRSAEILRRQGLLLDHLPGMLACLCDADGRVVLAAGAALRDHGVLADDLIGLTPGEYLLAEDADRVHALLGGDPGPPSTDATGRVMVATNRPAGSGGAGEAIVVVHDARLRVPPGGPAVAGERVGRRSGGEDERGRDRSLRALDRFSSLFEHGFDAVTVMNVQGVIVYASPALMAIVGLTTEEARGSRVDEWIHPGDLDRATAAVAHVLSDADAVITLECRLRHVREPWRHVEVTLSNRLTDPAVRGLVGNIHDVSERVAAAERLSHLAMHDTLTELPNRALLMDRLEQALGRASRVNRPCAVLFIDLDRFTQINDTLGHGVGDQLLRMVAARLQQSVRPFDSVARLGGDEFVVVASDLDSPRRARLIAERIRSALAKPFVLLERAISLGCSIGIAISSTHAPEELIQEADMALYRAKEQGRNRVEIYDQTMRVRARRRLDVEHLVRRAVADSLVSVRYQPIIDLADGSPVGAEALARLQVPGHDDVEPSEFIAVAEDCGLIVQLGAAVLGDACAQLACWRPLHAGSRRISVNVSARQLAWERFVPSVARALESAGVPGEMLCLELTESSLIEGGTGVDARLEALKALGVTLAIDDFGTGWSSLAYLRRFPIDVVKIDRSFVAGLGIDAGDTEVVRAIIGLGHSLGLTTVAEGVEREEQQALLRELGCDRAQGYLYGRPLVAADLPF